MTAKKTAPPDPALAAIGAVDRPQTRSPDNPATAAAIAPYRKAQEQAAATARKHPHQ